MQCFETDLKSDTLLIFDYEEMNSEKLQMYSSLDTLVLNCEEVKQKKHHRHYKTKHEHRQKSGHQKKKNTASVSKKSGLQDIHVERQDLNCIINTSVCEHKNSRSCNDKSSKDTKSKNIERPVPHCLKQLCRRPRHHDSRFHRHHKEHHCKTGIHRNRDLNRTHNCMGQSKHVHNKGRHSRHEKRSKEKLSEKPTEPELILPQLVPNEPDYEEISTKSLENYLEIPSSYKNVIKTCQEEYHESKLDTLIKRAKERERKLVEQSRKTIHCYTSTPLNAEISCSEMDVSLCSQSTLILEPQDYDYPSNGYYSNRCFKYSPCSPIRNKDNLLKLPEMDFELNIKHETTDIEVYSPTQSPDLLKLFDIDEPQVNKEIKIEPKKEKSDNLDM